MKRGVNNMDDTRWYVLAGCALVGLGIGMALDSAGAGIIIGAGVGFLAMIAAPYLRK